MDTKDIPEVCTSEILAEMTGINVKTIQRLTRDGLLRGRPPRGLTRPVLYRREDVIDWLFGGEAA